MSDATRATAYSTQFEAVSDAFIATVAGCTDEQWRRTTASEQWPVGVVAHHMAEVYGAFGQTFAEPAPAGQEPMPLTSGFIDENNARHAREHADAGHAETLDLLRANRAALARTIRGLDDEQLDSTAVTFDGHGMSVDQLVEAAIVAHTQEHLASIRDTIAD